MRKATIITMVIAVVSTAALADPVISSFQGNGEITVTNTTPGHRYSVQWRTSLSTGEWNHTWQDLREIQATSDKMVFEVPMFFRVLEGADLTPPANAMGFAANPSDQTVSLSWANPLDGDFAGVVVVRSTTGIPDSPTNGTVVYDGLGTSYSDSTLANGTEYYYRVFAYDSDTNYASGAVASATPVANVTTTTVTESFSDANGLNNLVDTARTTSHYDTSVDRYLAAYPSISDSAEKSTTWGWERDWRNIRTISVPTGMVARVSSEVRKSSTGQTGHFIYRFYSSDETYVQSAEFTTTSTSYVPATFENPEFDTRVVSRVELWVGITSSSSPPQVFERNAVVSTVYRDSAIEILNPSSGGNITQTYLDITAVREAYDAISYQLTDGITTNSYASFSTWYPVTNALTNPTRIRVLLTPASTNLTEGGTGLISVDFRMKKQ